MNKEIEHPEKRGNPPNKKLPLATLVHISDLHFGKDFTAEENVLARIAKKVPHLGGLLPHSYQAARAVALRINQVLRNRCEARIPTVVAFTGDLTSSGEEAEFTVGNTFLRSSHCLGAGNYVGLELKGELQPTISDATQPVLFPIPGNHDIWNRGDPRLLGVYRRTFPGPYPVTLEVETRGPKIILHGVDSTLNTGVRHKLARGRLPIEDLEILEERLLLGGRQGAIQIVCIHHTLRDPTTFSLDPTMTLEDREILGKRLLKAGADLVLAGHIHQWFVERQAQDEFPAHLTIGTATQQCSDRSFALLDIFEKFIRVAIFEFDIATHQFVRKDFSCDIPINPHAQAVRA